MITTQQSLKKLLASSLIVFAVCSQAQAKKEAFEWGSGKVVLTGPCQEGTNRRLLATIDDPALRQEAIQVGLFGPTVLSCENDDQRGLLLVVLRVFRQTFELLRRDVNNQDAITLLEYLGNEIYTQRINWQMILQLLKDEQLRVQTIDPLWEGLVSQFLLKIILGIVRPCFLVLPEGHKVIPEGHSIVPGEEIEAPDGSAVGVEDLPFAVCRYEEPFCLQEKLQKMDDANRAAFRISFLATIPDGRRDTQIPLDHPMFSGCPLIVAGFPDSIRGRGTISLTELVGELNPADLMRFVIRGTVLSDMTRTSDNMEAAVQAIDEVIAFLERE